MNIASRIEDANKTLGTTFLMSEALFNQVQPAPVEVRRTQAVLKGRHGPFQLVEVIGFAAPDAALLVQSTIGVLLQHRKRFTQELYERLFALAPAARGLFRGGLESQGEMLAHMMQFLVHAMSRPDIMSLGLRDLGRRHEGYGVALEYYPAFRQAFLESARGVLGDRHTSEVEKAWRETIDLIIEQMRRPVVP
jgi:hemoglobin-like flavoprotein